ncbi:hypothetical protein ABC337_15310 [Arthrobacter sp. 1P04PC]|uniref:hypothetical protein n=1 Tax=unclassified Arthrobacter TaxID=235627 RepID=UPI00399F4D1E
MSGLQLGQRVRFSTHLRRKTKIGEGYYADITKVWTTEAYPGKQYDGGEGIIIGKRTLANGKNQYNGYDEPIMFIPKERISVWLVAFDINRKPVHVLPEHLEVIP